MTSRDQHRQGIISFQADDWQQDYLNRQDGLNHFVGLKWVAGTYPNGEQWIRLTTIPQTKLSEILFLVRFRADQDLSKQLFRLLLLMEIARHYSDQLRFFMPYMPYSLQDREVNPGEAVGAKVLIKSLTSLGLDEISVVDVHSERDLQDWGIPVHHLSAEDLLIEQIKQVVSQEKIAIIAPDGGAASRAQSVADKLSAPAVKLTKTRLGPGKVEISTQNLQDIAADHFILVDDLLNTGGTMAAAAQTIKNKLAGKLSIMVTHGLFAGSALAKLNKSGIDHLFYTDSYLPDLSIIDNDELNCQLHQVSVGSLVK